MGVRVRVVVDVSRREYGLSCGYKSVCGGEGVCAYMGVHVGMYVGVRVG